MAFKDYYPETRLAMYETCGLFRVDVLESGRVELIYVTDKPSADKDYVFPEDIMDENGNINCTNCTDCKNCRDCTGCRNCVDCSNCIGCTDCIDIERSENCSDCKDSEHLVGCKSCIGCEDMARCTFCLEGFNCGDCHYCEEMSHIANFDGRVPKFSSEFFEAFKGCSEFQPN